ncbi:MAG: sodium-dependent bicarbonate transport family permease [Phycisphaerae bacterium]
MSLDLVLQNLTSPAILFFALGVVAALIRSDLDLPQPLPRVLSLYLLFAIGFKGGIGLRAMEADQVGMVLVTLTAAVLFSALLPVGAYAILRRRLTRADAAAVAAAYGSVSAVTFITAAAYLGKLDITYGGYMVAAMAFMESPAIVAGVLLARLGKPDAPPRPHTDPPEDPAGETLSEEAPATPSAVPSGDPSLDAHTHATHTRAITPTRPRLGPILQEAFLGGPVFLLLGSLLVGLLSSRAGVAVIAPTVSSLFDVVLVLFLLDMGLLAARRLGDLRAAGLFLIGFGLLLPLAAAVVGVATAWLIGLPVGDALLLTVLFASASYIAVPAAMRISVPEANASLYVPLALAVTFPFNIVVGIPLYLGVIRMVW